MLVNIKEIICPECGSKDLVKLNYWYQCLDCEGIIYTQKKKLKYDKTITEYLSDLIEEARKRNVSEEKLSVFIDAIESFKSKKRIYI